MDAAVSRGGSVSWTCQEAGGGIDEQSKARGAGFERLDRGRGRRAVIVFGEAAQFAPESHAPLVGVRSLGLSQLPVNVGGKP